MEAAHAAGRGTVTGAGCWEGLESPGEAGAGRRRSPGALGGRGETSDGQRARARALAPGTLGCCRAPSPPPDPPLRFAPSLPPPALQASKKAKSARKEIFKRAESYVTEYRKQVGRAGGRIVEGRTACRTAGLGAVLGGAPSALGAGTALPWGTAALRALGASGVSPPAGGGGRRREYL